MGRKNSNRGRHKNQADFSYLIDEHIEKNKTELEDAVNKQIDSTTAAGIDGLGLLPLSNNKKINKDV